MCCSIHCWKYHNHHIIRNTPDNKAKLDRFEEIGLTDSTTSDTNVVLGGDRPVVVTLGCNGVDLPIGLFMFVALGGVKSMLGSIFRSNVANFNAEL